MSRMVIQLEKEENIALWELAKHEKRSMRDQAALLIRQGLERRGLLSSLESAPANGKEVDNARAAN